ncbi:MAG TPA: peptide chain release factor N(5)-glutamine methyltransferase [Lacipirellulaceae bacterium]|jgi:release factor glutamine methyltransferase
MTQSDDHWTIGRLLQWTIEYLGRHGAENPRLDAEVLLAAARGCKRIDLYAAYGEEATETVRNKFRDMVRHRAEGTPVAYLVGHKEFYSLEFEVTREVLIPRPETELLVVALLDHAKTRGPWGPGLGRGDSSTASAPSDHEPSVAGPQPPAPSIADVGTGSGILAVCAAKYLPSARVTAIDISSASLAVAKRNAEKHGVVNRIEFVESNLFAALPAHSQFDCILSNPPYVSTAEMTELPPGVKDHEPHLALAAGEYGTDVIAPLIEQSATRLHPGGLLGIEISPMIATAVEQLIRDQPALDLGKTIRDAAGHARVIQAIKKLA